MLSPESKFQFSLVQFIIYTSVIISLTFSGTLLYGKLEKLEETTAYNDKKISELSEAVVKISNVLESLQKKQIETDIITKENKESLNIIKSEVVVINSHLKGKKL